LLAISGAALYSAHGDFDKTKELLDKLLPALTGLIGSALGFYFGSKSSNARRPTRSMYDGCPRWRAFPFPTQMGSGR
jgi:hypothetical protein